MKIFNTGSAHWTGGRNDGRGSVSTQSGALAAYPYGVGSRFEGKAGTNPEELLGAAHAACFNMSLSRILGEAKLVADWMETSAKVTLEQLEGAWTISAIHLTLRAKVPFVDAASFSELAAKAKAGCPVSEH
jgi:osmotically inducible protein OsmC